jgi:hypothetical protein
LLAEAATTARAKADATIKRILIGKTSAHQAPTRLLQGDERILKGV